LLRHYAIGRLVITLVTLNCWLQLVLAANNIGLLRWLGIGLRQPLAYGIPRLVYITVAHNAWLPLRRH